MNGRGGVGIVMTADNSQLLAKLIESGDMTQRQGARMVNSLKLATAQMKEMAGAQKAANDASGGMEKAASSMEHVGFASAGAKRELLVLAHELSQGNYSRFGGSLLVLAERTNAMALAFSGAGILIGAAAVGVGAFVAASVMGHLEAEKFAKSIIATGNAAGMTSDSFQALAASAARATGSSMGESKSSLQELISTGRIYPEVIGIATEASLNLQRVTGQSGEEIAKDFAKMGEGVTKWVAEHNRSMHFASLAQWEYIKRLEDAGRTSDAMREAWRLMNESLKTQEINLGYAERAWKSIKEAASGAWQAMLNVGKPETVQQQIDALQEQIRKSEQRLADAKASPSIKRAGLGLEEADLARLRTQLSILQDVRKNEERAATIRSQEAARADKGIAAAMGIKPEDTSRVQRVIDEIRRARSEAEQALGTDDKLPESYRFGLKMVTEIASAKNGFTVATKQAMSAELDETLQRMRSVEVQREELQLRNARIHAIVQEAAEQDKQHALVASVISGGADMARNIIDQTSALGLNAKQLEYVVALRQLDAAALKAQQGASADTAIEIVRMNEKMRENVTQMIDAKQAREKQLAGDVGGGLDTAAGKFRDDVENQAQWAGQMFDGAMKHMEDSIVDFARTGRLSFSSLFSFMAEEYLRNVIRMGQKDLFTDASGNFVGMGGLFSSVAGFFSGFSHASGLSYVPYDGYPAILHKGERVQTALQASSSSSAGGVAHFDFSGQTINVGQGVSIGQVANALKVQRNAIMGDISRRVGTKGYAG